jgi:protoporphyrinogen oxidase
MHSIPFLIVGGGPTGIGAAFRLREQGVRDWLLLEREDEAGGLASSVIDEHGFTWDLGGHVQFSHYESFDRYMDQALGADGWHHHQRESWVWISNRFVPYPFQNNLHRLPPEQRWKCVNGLMEVTQKKSIAETDKPAHFEDWILKTFGPGIAEVFLLPYNFKVWAHPPSTMGAKWVGERVAVPPLERVLKAVCLEQDDVSWGPNNMFRFPKRGGTGAVWRALADQLPQERLRLGTTVAHIDAKRHLAYLDDDSQIEYGHLISTIPVDILTRMLEIPELIRAAAKLPYSATHIVGVGLKGKPPAHLTTKCWMYFPEHDCPFYRVTVFSNYSPNNVPDPANQWSLMAEVAESEHKPVDHDRCVREVLEGMINTRLIERLDHVVSTWCRRLDHGYPTPGLLRDESLAVLLPSLEKHGIFSRGRFGAWKYEVSNQDHSFAQGREVVDRILDRCDNEAGPEPTLNRPDWVNARRNT